MDFARSTTVRSTLAVPVALGITLGLFAFMQALITGPSVIASQQSDSTAIRFGVRIEPIVPEVKPPPPKHQPPKPPPQRPLTPTPVSVPIDRTPADIPTPIMALGNGPGMPFSGGLPGSPFAESGPVPLVQIQPQYPRPALLAGQQGRVTVAFTVTAGGEVVDARVVDADPPGVFDRAVLRAIEKWRFRPQNQPGQVVYQVFSFSLDPEA